MGMGAVCGAIFRKKTNAFSGLTKSSHGQPEQPCGRGQLVFCGVKGQAALVLRIPGVSEWNVACRWPDPCSQPWLAGPVVVPSKALGFGGSSPSLILPCSRGHLCTGSREVG